MPRKLVAGSNPATPERPSGLSAAFLQILFPYSFPAEISKHTIKKGRLHLFRSDSFFVYWNLTITGGIIMEDHFVHASDCQCLKCNEQAIEEFIEAQFEADLLEEVEDVEVL
jgi:hypothetical protein